jgi:predicted ATPase
LKARSTRARHQTQPDAAYAEKCFRTAIEIARKQHAKSWELRATTSLARLLAKQRKQDKARTMLAEICRWFTEGFDAADLKRRQSAPRKASRITYPQLEELSPSFVGTMT